jgi:hypothetical protein
MEENTIFENTQKAQLELNEDAQNYLRTTATWTLFMAVIQFIGAGSIALFGLIFLAFGSMIPIPNMLCPIWLIGLLYLILGAICFIPAVYLTRFSSRTKNAIYTQQSEEMICALGYMKSYWKFCGILTIIMIAISILAIFIAIGAATLAM